MGGNHSQEVENTNESNPDEDDAPLGAEEVAEQPSEQQNNVNEAEVSF